MTESVVTFSITPAQENPLYANVLTGRYDKNYTNVRFAELMGNQTLRKGFKWFFDRMGVDVQEDTITYTIKSEKNAFSGLLGPSLSNKDGVLGMSIGGDFYPLPITKGKYSQKLNPDEEEIEFGFEKIEFNGYQEPTLKISLTRSVGEKTVSMWINLGLRLKDYKAKKDLTIEDLNLWLKRSPTKLLEVLDVPPEISNFEGETIKLDQLPIDETDFDFWKVVGYKALNISGRVSYLMELLGEVDEQGNPLRYFLAKDSEEKTFFERVQVWTNKSLNTFFQNEPELSDEKFAELIIKSKKPGKNAQTGKPTVYVEAAIIYVDESAKVDIDLLGDFDF